MDSQFALSLSSKLYYRLITHTATVVLILEGLSYIVYTGNFSTRIAEIFVRIIFLSMHVSVSIFIMLYSTHNVTISFAQGQTAENSWTIGTPISSPRTKVTALN